MKKKTKRLNITDQVRGAIENCGMTRYELSKRTGVAQSVLSRFATGERSLNLESLDKLAKVLGWKMDVGEIKRRKRK